jgi:hypothetical protein
MGKVAAPRKVGDKEALAVGNTIRGSARKLNLVAQLIRGRKVEEALNILPSRPRHGVECARCSPRRSPMPRTTTISTSTPGRCRGERRQVDLDEALRRRARGRRAAS